MKYSLPHRLADFLNLGLPTRDILLIESSCYIPKLLSFLPYAKIRFVSEDIYVISEVEKKYKFKISCINIAYNEEKLPFDENSFDIVIGDGLVDFCFNSQDILSGLGNFIRPTGYLITSFHNLLFEPWVNKLLCEKRSEFIIKRGYTKPDFERLSVASFFKEVYFYPLFEEGNNEPQDGETEPPFYIAELYKRVTPVRELMTMYDAGIRKKLSVLLRRIEFGVHLNESVQSLKQLMREENIFEEYMRDFMKQANYDFGKTRKILKKYEINLDVDR